jgi:hypothetical protein
MERASSKRMGTLDYITDELGAEQSKTSVFESLAREP